MQDHQFQAKGVASLVRLLRGSVVIWRGKTPLPLTTVPCSEIRTKGDVHTIPSDFAILHPHGRITLRAEFAEPAYLVSCRRMLDTIRNHFVLDVRLQSGWHDNLWPHYLNFYLETKRWPDSGMELGPIFSKVLRRGASSEQTTQIRALPWKQRIRKGFNRSLLARVGRDPVARGLAHEHWKALSRAFFNSKHHDAMVKAAQLTKRVQPLGIGCVPLRAEWQEDQLMPIMPPALAMASRIEIDGAASLESWDERRNRRISHITVTSGVLEPGAGFAVPGGVEVTAEAAHLCLVGGAKEAYGARMDAPIVCKGTQVHVKVRPNALSLWRRMWHRQARWRDPDWIRPDAQDPQHLRVEGTGEEA